MFCCCDTLLAKRLTIVWRLTVPNVYRCCTFWTTPECAFLTNYWINAWCNWILANNWTSRLSDHFHFLICRANLHWSNGVTSTDRFTDPTLISLTDVRTGTLVKIVKYPQFVFLFLQKKSKSLCGIELIDDAAVDCSIWLWQTSADVVVCAAFHPHDYTTVVTFGRQHVNFWKLFWDVDKAGQGRLLRDKQSGIFEVCVIFTALPTGWSEGLPQVTVSGGPLLSARFCSPSR